MIDVNKIFQEAAFIASNFKGATSTFHEELTMFFRGVELSMPEDFYPIYGEMLANIIYKHTGIRVRVRSDYYDFAVALPDINKNSIFSKEVKIGFLKYSTRDTHSNKEVNYLVDGFKGNVDLKNYRVSGAFSQVVCNFYVNPEQIKNHDLEGERTSEELAAVVMHEVGHVFTSYSTVVDMVTGVMPAMLAVNAITKTEDSEKRKLILETYNQRPEVMTKLDVKHLLGKSKEVQVTAILTNLAYDKKSASQSLAYDDVSSEQAANTYVAKMGAGNYLVSATIKNKGSMYSKFKKGKFKMFLSDITCIGWFILQLFLMTVVNPKRPSGIAAILFMAATCMGIAVTRSNAFDPDYDTLYHHHHRVKEDIIAMMKNPDIPKDVLIKLRNQVQEIDEIIDNTTKGTSLLGKWIDLLNAHSRKRVAQQDVYREIESMLNNDLFVVHRDLQLIV